MKKILLLLAVALVMLPVAAQASLNLSYQFVGKGNWSLSAVGSNIPPWEICRQLSPWDQRSRRLFYTARLYLWQYQRFQR